MGKNIKANMAECQPKTQTKKTNCLKITYIYKYLQKSLQEQIKKKKEQCWQDDMKENKIS